MDNMVGSGLLKIKDPNLKESLKRIGCDVGTYEEARYWFMRYDGFVITVFPSFGEKVGYDCFDLAGYLFQVYVPDLITGGVYLGSEMEDIDEFVNSYRSTKGLDDGEDYHPEEAPTYLIALERAIRFSLYLHRRISISEKHDNSDRVIRIQDGKEYPEFLKIYRNRTQYYLFIKVFTRNYNIGAEYKIWHKDISKKDLEIEVVWDGEEFIINSCENLKALENKRVNKASYRDFLYQKFGNKELTLEQYKEYYDDEAKSRTYITSN